MEKGGIAIREFEKLSTDESFTKACGEFKSRLNGEDDAREYAGLSNLNTFKPNAKHGEFIKRVGTALDFIKRRKQNRASRKVKKINGVTWLYDDERCFIVTPDGPESSNRAAYLDNATANWCIAIKDTEKAAAFWKQFDVNRVFYIFMKDNSESWAMVLNSYDAFCLKTPGCKNGNFPTIIENRSNKIGLKRHNVLNEYKKMLARTKLSEEKLKSLMSELTNDTKPATLGMVTSAIKDKNKWGYFKLALKVDFSHFSDCDKTFLLRSAIEQHRADILKNLIEKKGFEYRVLPNSDPISQTENGLTTKTTPGDELLFDAIEDFDCFKYLVELGLNPNTPCDRCIVVPTKSGFFDTGVHETLMYSAIRRLRYDVVRFLVDKGVSLKEEIKCFAKDHPLVFVDEDLPLFDLLIEQGYKPDATTLIQDAAAYGGSLDGRKILRLLSRLDNLGFRYDAKRNAHTLLPIEPQPKENGIERVSKDPIHDVVWNSATIFQFKKYTEDELNDFMKTVELLLKLGAPVNEKDFMGRTALNYAITSLYEPLVKLLLEHGAKPGAPVKRKWKEMFCLEFELSDEMVSLLKDYNIFIEA